MHEDRAPVHWLRPLLPPAAPSPANQTQLNVLDTYNAGRVWD